MTGRVAPVKPSRQAFFQYEIQRGLGFWGLGFRVLGFGVMIMEKKMESTIVPLRSIEYRV